MDIAHAILAHTWSNGRFRLAGITKRIDKFYLAEDLCERSGRYRSWNYSTGFYDHKAIILQVDFDISLISYPFKFYLVWLGDLDFKSMIKENWINNDDSSVFLLNPMHVLVNKLKLLKTGVTKWERQKKLDNNKALMNIEEEIQLVDGLDIDNRFTTENLQGYNSLVSKKQYLLLLKEETLRQKSRATWIKAGDNNNKFFHNFSNKRRLNNVMWEMGYVGDELHCDSRSLKRAANTFFQESYTDNNATNILIR